VGLFVGDRTFYEIEEGGGTFNRVLKRVVGSLPTGAIRG
jgi:hypothetical protein